MKISPEQWSQLRRAAFDDDSRKFEAMVALIVRAAVQEHRDVVERQPYGTPDGRPYLASCR